MCGIVGCVARQENFDAGAVMLEMLEKVDYRGYDNAGIAGLNKSGFIEVRKVVGKVENLAKLVAKRPITCSVGIGHTRWATHGGATEINAHPHVVGSVAVVHNGIIENSPELRKELEAEGCIFLSETDTEVVPQLANLYIKKYGLSPHGVVWRTIQKLKGSFALLFLFSGAAFGRKDFLIAAARSKPLVIGFGREGAFIGSDEISIEDHVEQLMFLEDGDTAFIVHDTATVFNNGRIVNCQIKKPDRRYFAVGKEGFSHYTLKEIFEQPAVIGKTLESILYAGPSAVSRPHSGLTLVGCGTAYNVCRIAKYWFEDFGIKVEADIGSEFRYRNHPISKNELGIFVSQSGETEDTLESMLRFKQSGGQTLGIVNVETSQIARLADKVLVTPAGREIGVASTKCFTSQMVTLGILALAFGLERSPDADIELLESIDKLPEDMQKALELSDSVKIIAGELVSAKSLLYIGRGTGYGLAMEGALKFVELSYIHAQALAAGELKHGPLALVDENVQLVVIAPRDRWFSKTVSNLREISARKGKIILLSDQQACEELKDFVWKPIVLPDIHPFISPMVYAVPLQLLAYHAAVLLGNDVDRPRNLAKSVTVE